MISFLLWIGICNIYIYMYIYIWWYIWVIYIVYNAQCSLTFNFTLWLLSSFLIQFIFQDLLNTWILIIPRALKILSAHQNDNHILHSTYTAQQPVSSLSVCACVLMGDVYTKDIPLAESYGSTLAVYITIMFVLPFGLDKLFEYLLVQCLCPFSYCLLQYHHSISDKMASTKIAFMTLFDFHSHVSV